MCNFFNKKAEFSENQDLVAKVSARSVSLGGCALHTPLRFWACASSLFQKLQRRQPLGNNPPTPLGTFIWQKAAANNDTKLLIKKACCRTGCRDSFPSTKGGLTYNKNCVIFSTKKPNFPRTKTHLVTKVSARSVSLGGCALHTPLRFCGCASWLFQNSKAAAAQQ